MADWTEEQRSAIEACIRRARGCNDYMGGYHSDRELDIYRHGIATVVNALTAMLDNPGALQGRVLDEVGARMDPLLDEFGRDLNGPNITPIAPFNRTEVDIIAGTDSPPGDGWDPVHAFVDGNGMNCVLWRREVSP